jgi:hypothetical protein
MSRSLRDIMPVVGRDTHIASQVLFLDGISGTGKTMMGAILSTFDRIEIQRLEHIYEYVCALHFLDRIEDDAAESLIRMYVDLACYNLMIGREVNFRWKDLSGVLANPRAWRYFLRLFQPDGAAAVDRIKASHPIVQIVSHQVLGIAQPLFSALGRRLTIVEMVRHPLYLLEHWSSFMDWIGRDPRDFTIWIRHGDSHLPWFALGWEERFSSGSPMDRAIYCIQWLNERMEDTLARLSETERKQVLVIPFERFVVDAWPFIRDLESLLEVKATSSTRRELRKQKVPRRLTTDGRDRAIYRRYNWEAPDRNQTEQEQLKKRWDSAARQASGEAMQALEQMCAIYEERYA